MFFRFWSHEKLNIISSPKVASRFLDSIFDVKPDDYKNQFTLNTDIKLHINEEYFNPQLIDEFHETFSKTNKKDILILYRNPYKKLLTGIIQDFNIFLLNTPILHRFLAASFFTDVESLKYIRFDSEKMRQYLDNIESHQSFLDFYKRLLESYLDFSLKSSSKTFNTVHTKSGLYILHTLISDKIYDKTKLHLVDIDIIDDLYLEEFLKKYLIKFEPNISKNSNNVFKDILEDIIENSEYYKDTINEILEEDYFFYELISKKNRFYEIRN
jgi:hypothetical protein